MAVHPLMNRRENGPFTGNNKASSTLVTLVIASFAICLLYIVYRQLNRLLEAPSVINPHLNGSAPTVNLDQMPILWDVYVERERFEWEWHSLKVSELSDEP